MTSFFYSPQINDNILKNRDHREHAAAGVKNTTCEHSPAMMASECAARTDRTATAAGKRAAPGGRMAGTLARIGRRKKRGGGGSVRACCDRARRLMLLPAHVYGDELRAKSPSPADLPFARAAAEMTRTSSKRARGVPAYAAAAAVFRDS